MENIINIGNRLELFVDDYLISKMENVSLKLNSPCPGEIVMEFNRDWEGNTCGYVTVFKDNGIYRMYYRGSHYDFEKKGESHPTFVCYAESKDGINWTRPDLGIFVFKGSKKNNIIWSGTGSHNFTPFKDTNPDTKPDERYKAVGSGENEKRGLFAFISSDGIVWKILKDEPIITDGAFDSQNLAFYDHLKELYFEYHRGWSEGGYKGIRDIMVCTSKDFVNWTKPEFLFYYDSAKEHLYTNAITPYFRAPHIYLGFPKRFVPERQKANHPVSGVSDGLFMSSRDGFHWKRWNQAFIRPGLQPERWINRNNMTAWGIIETKSRLNPEIKEISIYSSEAYYTKGNRLRRYTIRMDGFVSISATGKQGHFITKPLTFEGTELFLNYSTSAAGFIKIEIMSLNGKKIEGFSTDEIFGDSIEEKVLWKSGKDLKEISGLPVILRFTMKDADIYSIRFQ